MEKAYGTPRNGMLVKTVIRFHTEAALGTYLGRTERQTGPSLTASRFS